jgi:hypothetical protein
LFNHSHRAFFWAKEMGQTRQKFDVELLFICAAFHDLGLLKKFSSATGRFEVDSANAVRQFLEQHGVPNARIQTAWGCGGQRRPLSRTRRTAGVAGRKGSVLMPHLLIAGKLHPSGMALLNSTPGLTYDYVEDVSEESYAPFIDKADALVIRTQPLGRDRGRGGPAQDRLASRRRL